MTRFLEDISAIRSPQAIYGFVHLLVLSLLFFLFFLFLLSFVPGSSDGTGVRVQRNYVIILSCVNTKLHVCLCVHGQICNVSTSFKNWQSRLCYVSNSTFTRVLLCGTINVCGFDSHLLRVFSSCPELN